MYDTVRGWLASNDIPEGAARILEASLSLLVLVILAFLTSWFARRHLAPLIEKAVRKTSTTWDDAFAERKFFVRLARLLPVVIVYAAADLMFPSQSQIAEIVRRLAMTIFVLGGAQVMDSLLLAVQDIYSASDISANRPIKGYVGAVKIVLYILAAIFVVSILTDKSPWGILSVLGGLTAVLLLVFKDTILGFVANLQLSGLDMVRVGDWIEMPKYGADGDVIDVSIHTIKVRNWDKTITTVPTYALVSDAFKNWRGMAESGGRRIKRALYIDMKSIQFCTDEMLARFERFELLKEHIKAKKAEIDEYNKKHAIDTALMPNGRRQTNIGVFRAYVSAYLMSHPKIHKDMTFLVRHLQPTAQGLPLEIYVFSNDQVWANYEAIQADIFDHILAVVPEFELRVFQYPSGYDLQQAQFLET